VVLNREEVRLVFASLDGVPLLGCSLLYGAGLRLFEALCLRVKDIDFLRQQVPVRDGKGQQTGAALRLFEVLRPSAAPAAELWHSTSKTVTNRIAGIRTGGIFHGQTHDLSRS
jgi:hypothetical protein